MDLGIAGKNALVCAASKGLGRACAEHLAQAGVNLTITARGVEALEATAAYLRGLNPAITVKTVAGDIATADGRAAALDTAGDIDILINNAGGPPPGNFRDWDRKAWNAALEANMLTPIDLIKATVDGMIARKFGRIVNITSGAVKAPIATLGLSNGARSGLTGFVAGVAREVARHNVTINGLLPGRFLTDRLTKNFDYEAQKAGIAVDEHIRRASSNIPAQRFGEATEFGAACAFLCSVHASYIVGQNLLIDGGAYPGTF